METLEAVVAVGAADVLTVEVTGFTVLVAALEETAPLPPQLPKPDWQPVPQWSVCKIVSLDSSYYGRHQTTYGGATVVVLGAAVAEGGSEAGRAGGGAAVAVSGDLVCSSRSSSSRSLCARLIMMLGECPKKQKRLSNKPTRAAQGVKLFLWKQYRRLSNFQDQTIPHLIDGALGLTSICVRPQGRRFQWAHFRELVPFSSLCLNDSA